MSGAADRGIGLCADCAHVRPTPSAKGTLFYRCARSDVDRRYARYPTLPVLRCGGHEPRSERTPRAAGVSRFRNG